MGFSRYKQTGVLYLGRFRGWRPYKRRIILGKLKQNLRTKVALGLWNVNDSPQISAAGVLDQLFLWHSSMPPSQASQNNVYWSISASSTAFLSRRCVVCHCLFSYYIPKEWRQTLTVVFKVLLLLAFSTAILLPCLAMMFASFVPTTFLLPPSSS